MKRFYLIAVAAAALAFSYGTSALAGGSVWLPAPGEGSVTLSYVWQGYDKVYRGADKQGLVPEPSEMEITQHTVWVDGKYGISDSLALDLRVGLAKGSIDSDIPREFLALRVETSEETLSGLADVNFGVTWRVADEAVSRGGGAEHSASPRRH